MTTAEDWELWDYECDLAIEDERGRHRGQLIVVVPKFRLDAVEKERDEAIEALARWDLILGPPKATE